MKEVQGSITWHLGERRANSAKDYLMTYGISGNRLSVISYGKEKTG